MGEPLWRARRFVEPRRALLRQSPSYVMLTPDMRQKFVVALLVGSTWGCGSKSNDGPTTFGGEGASVAGPDARPLPADDGRPRLTGPCEKAPPPGQDAQLDDFEDGDHQLFKTYHREGWWFTADDGTQGGTVSPEKGEFKAVLLPDGERTSENSMAVHLSAAGMTQWGVVWGTTIQHKHGGLSCPFNASAFDGVAFRAKGPGTIKLKISTIETSPPENGGICKEGCWDAHMKVIRMESEWREFFVRFDSLQQEGWGTDSRFDRTRLLALNFTAGPEMLPVDFWLDDVRFIQKGEKPAPLPPHAQDDQSTQGRPNPQGQSNPQGQPNPQAAAPSGGSVTPSSSHPPVKGSTPSTAAPASTAAAGPSPASGRK